MQNIMTRAVLPLLTFKEYFYSYFLKLHMLPKDTWEFSKFRGVFTSHSAKLVPNILLIW